MDRKIDTALIVREAFALIGANPMPTLGALAALVAASTAVDVFASNAGGLNFGIALAAMFAQFGVTRAGLGAAGLLAEGMPVRAGSFVGALILTGLGIMIGFVFLILPGIYLWVRWSLVAPLIAGEGMRAGEAISESWARTQGLVGPISAALLIFSVPVMLFIVTLAFHSEYEAPPIGLALISNLLAYSSQALGWNCAVAIHALIQPPSNDLEEVFA